MFLRDRLSGTRLRCTTGLDPDKHKPEKYQGILIKLVQRVLYLFGAKIFIFRYFTIFLSPWESNIFFTYPVEKSIHFPYPVEKSIYYSLIQSKSLYTFRLSSRKVYILFAYPVEKFIYFSLIQSKHGSIFCGAQEKTVLSQVLLNARLVRKSTDIQALMCHTGIESRYDFFIPKRAFYRLC